MDEFARAVEATISRRRSATLEEISEHVGEGDVERALGSWRKLRRRGIELVERAALAFPDRARPRALCSRRPRGAAAAVARGDRNLAIIAYHEPVSRAEIEAIRGVQISKGTLDVLMEAGWVRTAGRREGPGRPLLYATTQEFLTHFGLGSRATLPGSTTSRPRAARPLDEGVFELLQLQLESEEEED
jgi:segregation and condensation protein B